MLKSGGIKPFLPNFQIDATTSQHYVNKTNNHKGCISCIKNEIKTHVYAAPFV